MFDSSSDRYFSSNYAESVTPLKFCSLRAHIFIKRTTFAFLKIKNVDAFINQLSAKRAEYQNTPRRQCNLHPGPRGEPGVLGKV